MSHQKMSKPQKDTQSEVSKPPNQNQSFMQTPHHILQLQRTHGNAFVNRMLNNNGQVQRAPKGKQQDDEYENFKIDLAKNKEDKLAFMEVIQEGMKAFKAVDTASKLRQTTHWADMKQEYGSKLEGMNVSKDTKDSYSAMQSRDKGVVNTITYIRTVLNLINNVYMLVDDESRHAYFLKLKSEMAQSDASAVATVAGTMRFGIWVLNDGIKLTSLTLQGLAAAGQHWDLVSQTGRFATFAGDMSSFAGTFSKVAGGYIAGFKIMQGVAQIAGAENTQEVIDGAVNTGFGTVELGGMLTRGLATASSEATKAAVGNFVSKANAFALAFYITYEELKWLTKAVYSDTIQQTTLFGINKTMVSLNDTMQEFFPQQAMIRIFVDEALKGDFTQPTERNAYLAKEIEEAVPSTIYYVYQFFNKGRNYLPDYPYISLFFDRYASDFDRAYGNYYARLKEAEYFPGESMYWILVGAAFMDVVKIIYKVVADLSVADNQLFIVENQMHYLAEKYGSGRGKPHEPTLDDLNKHEKELAEKNKK